MTTPTINDWSILFFDEAFNEGVKRAARLGGTVDNHPHIADGSPIVTSKLKSFSSATMTAETSNRKYILGKPSPGFEFYLKSVGKTVDDYDKY